MQHLLQIKCPSLTLLLTQSLPSPPTPQSWGTLKNLVHLNRWLRLFFILHSARYGNKVWWYSKEWTQHFHFNTPHFYFHSFFLYFFALLRIFMWNELKCLYGFRSTWKSHHRRRHIFPQTGTQNVQMRSGIESHHVCISGGWFSVCVCVAVAVPVDVANGIEVKRASRKVI